jgi:acetyl esterase/lipase
MLIRRGRDWRRWRAGSTISAAILLAWVLLPASAGAGRGPAGTQTTPAAPAAIAAAGAVDAASTTGQAPADDVLAAAISSPDQPAIGVETSGSGGVGGASDLLPTPASPEPAAPEREPTAPLTALYAASPISMVADVPFTQPVDCGSGSCRVTLDVYVPTGPGPYPTVVLLRGGPSGIGGRAYLDSFATSLAETGLLVFSADVRDLASQGGGYPEALEDAACAVRFARVQSAAYGGDGGSVTLIGHSFGSYLGSLLALNADEYKGSCIADGDGRPDAFVGLAGCYDPTAGRNSTDFAHYFGGSSATTAAARTAGDPYSYATRAPIPVRLVAGTSDGTVDPSASVSLNGFLKGRGWNVGLSLVPGGTHMSILWTVDARQAIFGAISLTHAYADALDPIKGRTGS